MLIRLTRECCREGIFSWVVRVALVAQATRAKQTTQTARGCFGCLGSAGLPGLPGVAPGCPGLPGQPWTREGVLRRTTPSQRPKSNMTSVVACPREIHPWLAWGWVSPNYAWALLAGSDGWLGLDAPRGVTATTRGAWAGAAAQYARCDVGHASGIVRIHVFCEARSVGRRVARGCLGCPGCFGCPLPGGLLGSPLCRGSANIGRVGKI